MSEELSERFEKVVLNIAECFIYKIPPLRTASGHRAEDWDLANPILTAYLRIFQADAKLKIIIYSYKDPTSSNSSEENLKEFGQCPFEIIPKEPITPFVDSVIDSSRYFVLKLKDPRSTKTTNIGIGFRERDTAFDFRNALNECVRFVDRMALASSMSHQVVSHGPDEEGSDIAVLHHQVSDLSLKEGVKIKIPMKAGASHRPTATTSAASKPSSSNSSSSSSNSFVPLLRPPAPHVATAASTCTSITDLKPKEEDEDDWGDFDQAN